MKLRPDNHRADTTHSTVTPSSFQLFAARRSLYDEVYWAMSVLRLVVAIVLYALEFLGVPSSKISTSSNLSTMGCHNAHLLVTDLTFNVCSPTDPPSTCARDPRRWHRIEKELYLHTAQQSAWLYIAQVEEEELTKDDLVITDIRVGELSPSVGSNISWESRPGGIWVLSSNYTGRSDQAVTGIDVLFGLDVVDPRPEWDLIQNPLHLNAPSEVPVARLSVRHGRAKGRPDGPQTALRAKEDGKFKIVQISDTHMVTGLGVCTDTIDAHGEPLPESEADPRTIDFLGGILDTEKPDLVILTGDQVHHDIPDSQSAIFKVVAPLIERSIPYAAVFGNHDDEGPYALSRRSIVS